jgi:hypothetical protein
MVARDVRHMIGLGRGEQHLVDVLAADQLRQQIAGAVTEALQNRLEREPLILERIAAGEQRAQYVHEHDLPREPAEVILVEAADHLALVDVVALLHQRAQRIGRQVRAVRHVERREPEERRVGEIARTQEASGLEKAQPMRIARAGEEGAVEVVRLLRGLLAHGLAVAMLLDELEEFSSRLGAQAAPVEPQRRARPLGVGLVEQRQVEQPFAGIVDDAQRDRRRVAADLGEELPRRVRRGEAELDADLAQVVGARRPRRRAGRHRLDVLLIAEARQPSGAGGFQPRANEPAAAGHAEQRHAVGIVGRAQEIVDEAGDEHRLAGTAQARHREVDGRALRHVGDVGGFREPFLRLGEIGRIPGGGGHRVRSRKVLTRQYWEPRMKWKCALLVRFRYFA